MIYFKYILFVTRNISATEELYNGFGFWGTNVSHNQSKKVRVLL